MSQAKELLNGMSEEIPVHTHPVSDTDTYFIIDPITRKIGNVNPMKKVIMQYDHNSERFTFELPRYIDGHDMLECTSVTVNVDNIEVVESDEAEPRINSDAPDMTDLRTHPTDPEKVITSWLISRNSTQLPGILSFHIEFKCVDSNGNVVYEWSTDTYDEIEIRARKKNGEGAIIEHTDLLEQWRTRIFGAGDSVMADIAAEGEAQVAAVKAESETQQEAVELKGAQTLESIPEDYTEVDAMAEDAVRSKGKAIVCEAAGESIVLKDSSNDHIRGLKVFGKSTQFTTTGKNLVDMKDFEFDDSNYTHWVSTDSVSASSLYEILKSNPGKSIVLSATIVGTPSGIDIGSIRFYDENNDLICGLVPGVEHVILESIPDTFKTAYIYGSATGASIKNLQIEYGKVATDYEPYTGGKPSPSPEYPQEIVSIETPSIAVHSKNLIPFPYPMFANSNTDEVDVTVMDDGGVLINGTPTVDTFINLCKYDFGPNHISPSTASGFIVNKHSSGIWVAYDGKNKITFIMVKSGTVCNNEVVYPQLEAGTVVTEYEKGSGRQSFGIDRTLSGIPVTSGGNYTDSDGQQWICDEVDLERGVYVQRVGIKDFDGSDDEDWGGVSEVTDNMRSWITVQGACRPESDTANGIMCSQFMPQVSMNKGAFYQNRDRFFFGSGMTLNEWKTHLQSKPLRLVYVPSTPIETPLTAEEIAAFKALRTNYPNTTILNDAGAWMSVKYNADTKSYIDKPKTLRLTDTSTGVVYELKIVDGSLTVNPVT